jgi:phosphosulfolactate synthase (CoM biosynthesis protein A)
MRFRAILSVSTLFLLFFTIAAFAESQSREGLSKGFPANQSVSGKIASVGDAAFTVSVTPGKQQADKDKPQAVEFLVDDKTRVEGKLDVGANVLVEYRSDSGRNIAVHVVVTPAS